MPKIALKTPCNPLKITPFTITQRFALFVFPPIIQTTVMKKNKMKILVAIARKILVAVWHMISKGEDFIDIYLKRLQEQKKMEEQIKRLESTVNR